MNYRSRLVGTDVKTGVGDSVYALAPPLEPFRYIFSDAATWRGGKAPGEQGRQVIVNDVARAYLYATCTRDVYIALKAEDGAGPDMGPHHIRQQ